MLAIRKHAHLIIPVTLTIVTGIVMLLPDETFALLSYRRDAVASFHWWPFLTANLVHSNGVHWFVNVAGLWILWRLFFDSFKPRHWLWVLAILMISNILLIHFFTPRITNYVGMSGALHGMICVGFIARNYLARFVGIVGTLVVIAKVIHENWFQTQNTMAELIGRNVAVEAHLYGVIVGVMIGVMVRCWQEGWLITANSKNKS